MFTQKKKNEKKGSKNHHQIFPYIKAPVTMKLKARAFFWHQNEIIFRSQILAKFLNSKQLYCATSQHWFALGNKTSKARFFTSIYKSTKLSVESNNFLKNAYLAHPVYIFISHACYFKHFIAIEVVNFGFLVHLLLSRNYLSITNFNAFPPLFNTLPLALPYFYRKFLPFSTHQYF